MTLPLRFSVLPCLLTALALGNLSFSSAPSVDDGDLPVDFTRDVRPILARTCFPCHGPDAGARQADLRLDQREGALGDRGGYQVFLAGDLEASEGWQRIQDGDDPMPPLDSGIELDPADALVLQGWIDGTNAGFILRKRDELDFGRINFKSITDATISNRPSLEFDVVPEPGAFLLMTLGVAGLGFVRRRRQSMS